MFNAEDPPSPAPAGALRFRDHVESGFGLEEMNKLRQQLKTRLAFQIVDAVKARLKLHSAVDRFERYHAILAGFDAAAGDKIDGEIHGGRIGVKQEKRRNINCSAGKVYPCRG